MKVPANPIQCRHCGATGGNHTIWCGAPKVEQQPTLLRAELAAERERYDKALGYATRLAVALWKNHFGSTPPEWKPLPDLLGVLTQIDNMTTGIAAAERERCAQLLDAGAKIHSNPDLADLLRRYAATIREGRAMMKIKQPDNEHQIDNRHLFVPVVCDCGWKGRTSELIVKDVLRCPRCGNAAIRSE